MPETGKRFYFLKKGTRRRHDSSRWRSRRLCAPETWSSPTCRRTASRSRRWGRGKSLNNSFRFRRNKFGSWLRKSSRELVRSRRPFALSSRDRILSSSGRGRCCPCCRPGMSLSAVKSDVAGQDTRNLATVDHSDIHLKLINKLTSKLHLIYY